MKVKIVLEADIDDDHWKLMQELRKVIAENEALAAFKIIDGQVKWVKEELATN